MATTRKILRKTGTASTSGAATATVVSQAIPDNTVALIEVRLVGKDADGAVASAKLSHRAKMVSGTLSLVGSAVDLVTFVLGSDAALTTCAATIDNTGTVVTAKVTGVALKDIEWFGEITIWVC